MDRAGLGAGPIADICVLSGGTQNILIEYSRAGCRYVLRRPPQHPRPESNETMRREARVLAALASTRVPHPGLIAACPDETVIGAAFYLMEPVDGFVPTNGLPARHAGDATLRRRIGLSVAEAIARLGALDYRSLGLDGFGRPDKFLERQVGRWRRQLDGYADQAGWPGAAALPGVEQVGRWLDAHRPRDAEPGILHGDIHLANVMIAPDSGEVAALVDWELSTIGDPLLDLGWLLATWPEGDEPQASDVAVRPWSGFAGPAELVASYRGASDRDLSALDWYVVLACYKLGIILEGTYARACAGKAPRETGERLHRQAVGLFERALRTIH